MIAASAPDEGDAAAPSAPTWHWPDEAACAASAAALAARLAAARGERPDAADLTIELHGPLGAGKTTFVRHLLRALGVSGRIKSPTYTVVEPYRIEAPPGAAGSARTAALDIFHFDFYRFADARELVDAGLRETFAAPGLKLVEWPARAGPWLPVPDLRLEIEPRSDESRLVRVQARTPRGEALLR
jgi:tRNA threonylcarbamoyladenosine biosynthesis protein TsaE